MMSNVRQAFRTLTKSPGFSALVVAVLAIGIAANTTIFSIVNGVLLKPLPFADAGRLVAVDETVRSQVENLSFPDFLDFRAQAASFERLAVFTGAGVTLTGLGEATGLSCAIVSADLLPLLGVQPLRGQLFTPEDDNVGAPRRAIITESLWSSRFSRDDAIVGRTIVLSGDPFTVIGVMPAGFEFPFDAEDPPQLWLPVRASNFAAQWAEQRSASFLRGIGRLREGVTVASAQAEMTTIAGRLAAQYPRNQNRGVLVRPYRDVLIKDYRLGFIVLLGAVAAVLLIACANVANLLLARGSARRREMAIRSALGASRAQIVGQLLSESLALSVIGGILGAGLALWGVVALVRFSPLQIPRLQTAHLDGAALLFTVLVSIITGLLCGLVPAFQLSRANGSESLKDGDRGGSGPGSTRTRQALVVAEMAISLMLLAAAGLLARSFVGLQRVNPGFVTERALVMQLMLPGARYSDEQSLRAFYARLREGLQTLPAVSATGLSTTMPMSGNDVNIGFTIEGRPAEPGQRLSAAFYAISPEYFATMGIPVVRGRGFTERDGAQAPGVLVISQATAAKYWPGEDPIGKWMTIGYNKTGPRQIVGIVADVKQASLADPLRPQVYAPFDQTPWPFIAAVVRTTASPEAAAASMRTLLGRLDPMQGAGDIRTLEQYVSRSVATPRFTAFLIGAFAGFALLLAGFGLFSVMAYSVAQRRREIGIRMALGAQAGDLRGMVVSQAVRLGAAGIALGLVGALAVTRVLDTLLYNVRPDDPATLAGVSFILFAVMLLAAYWPARRATRVDPITALRTE